MSDFQGMTLTQLISAYNGLVTQALAAGLKGFKQVKSFHDKEIARERCNAVATALATEGQLEHFKQEGEAEAASNGPLSPEEIENLDDEENVQIVPPAPKLVASADEDPEPTDEELNARRMEHTVVNGQAPPETEEKVASAKAAKPKSKAAKPATKKKAAAPAKTGNKSGMPSKFSDTSIITILAKSNPKQPGSAGYDRFALYKNGMSVAKALAAGVRRADLNWDVGKGFIKIK